MRVAWGRRAAPAAGRGPLQHRPRAGQESVPLSLPAGLEGRIRAVAVARERDPNGQPKVTTVQLTLLG
jgi:hypothetical protein